jgi:hypothetical protein
MAQIHILIDIDGSAVFKFGEKKENSYLEFCHCINYRNLCDHTFSTTYFIVEQAQK